jgi:hypothetical protein
MIRYAGALLVGLVAGAVLVVWVEAAAPASASGAPTAVACSNAATAPRFGGKTVDLTGIYSWTQGTFYVRQAGTCVYLVGQSLRDANGPPGKGFTSVFVGGIRRDLHVAGVWSDVPYGQVGGHGNLVWLVKRVGGTIHLTEVSGSGWGASDIVKTSKKVTIQG